MRINILDWPIIMSNWPISILNWPITTPILKNLNFEVGIYNVFAPSYNVVAPIYNISCANFTIYIYGGAQRPAVFI